MRVPKFITLELTNCCNLRCKGCFSDQTTYGKGYMDPRFFKSVIDRAASEGLQDKTIIVPYANGEPLLHPDVEELVSYTLQKGFKTYITTNGMFWNGSLFRLMLENFPQYYQTIFSLDGLWDDSSRSIELSRPGSNRRRIRENIERFLELKLALGSKLDVFIKMVRRGQDYAEEERFIDYWLRQDGMNCVIVGKMLASFDTEGMRTSPCQYPDDTFFLIRWDGTPTLCMYNPRMMNDQVRPMRKLEESDSIVGYYNSGVYAEFHEEQAKDIFRRPCDTCGIAYTGTGVKGVIGFRDKSLIQEPIYFKEDYYNLFYSLEDKSRPDSWYGYTPLGDAPRGREWLKA